MVLQTLSARIARIEHAHLPNAGNARRKHAYIPDASKARIEHTRVPGSNSPAANEEGARIATHRLSVVLPVYNEEEVIAATIEGLLETLHANFSDFEIIPVNDGSQDRSGAILTQLAALHPEIRVVTHERNLGYGATLADGFAAASKELTVFMDSDGQFDSRDLPRLLTFIDEYDAVLGYRLQRQDTWVRKLNAWGWKTLVRLLLGVHVRDIDCAFKILRTDFLQNYAPETRGAMINAEMLYNLKQAGYNYREVGVRHLPRQGGRATGANPRVILNAFRELLQYTWRRRVLGQKQVPQLPPLRQDRQRVSSKVDVRGF